MAPPGVIVGHTLGRYRIVEEIGAGGMGVIYRAHDERLDRDVALKFLPPGTVADEAARKRFRKEALALSKINHPNIATIHDFDTHEGLDFLVMEYIPGTTLTEKLGANPLPEREIVALGAQFAEGLSTAHEHGVIHRDLKPANLRLTSDGLLKILDFGLAALRLPVSATATTESLSEAQKPVGTLPYMAPEQLLGADVDARTDIYAAGLVLYEMATGQRALADLDRVQMVGAVLHTIPPRPGALNPHLSPELERIICKCLEKQPEHRYQSARELAIDLRRLDRSTQTASSKRRMVPIAVVLIFLLAAGAVALWHAYFQKAAPTPGTASIAVLPFADLSPNHDQEYFSDGLAEEILNDLTTIPDLKVVARTSAFQFKGKNEDLRDIGRKLNVDNVLEGSVRTEGTRVRIAAQLVKATDGFRIWSESYERDLKDVFTVQEDIAKAVSSALQLKLFAGKSSGSGTSQTANPEAYQAFLQAKYLFRMGDKESARKALDYVNQAIQADPGYAAAYAWRAGLTLSLGGMAWTDYRKAREDARRDVEKAIELDPTLADAYRVLSGIQALAESDCRTGEVTVATALRLAPGDAESLGQSGFIAMCLGRQQEAVELLKRALELDPLQPIRYLRLAQNLRDLGQFQEALEALGKALDINAHSTWVHETRGEVYLAEGNPQAALAEIENEPPGFLRDTGMAVAYQALGRRKESDAELSRLISSCSNDCAYQIAQVYAYRDEKTRAFEWLDRAYRQHDGGLMLLKTDLLLKNLRGDLRYVQLLESLNLPH